MVKFLLDAGADQEHKTDEMHTALMEASMVWFSCFGSLYVKSKYYSEMPFNYLHDRHTKVAGSFPKKNVDDLRFH